MRTKNTEQGRHRHRPHAAFAEARRARAFTLIEIIAAVAIVAILSAVALPSYFRYVGKANRVAAQVCMAEYANYMERYYTGNMRYDMSVKNIANADPHLDCQRRIAGNYAVVPATTATSFTIKATPTAVQATRENLCGMLTLDQRGTRTPDIIGCW